MNPWARGVGGLTAGVSALVLMLAGGGGPTSAAAAADVKVPVKPSTERTLRLPEQPFRYADLDLPAHFRTAAARRFDNTPASNPVTFAMSSSTDSVAPPPSDSPITTSRT